MWATEDERDRHFHDTTFIDAEERDYFDRCGFVVRVVASGHLDDGVEFITIKWGDPSRDATTWVSREFMHYEAFADAASFVNAMEESALYTLEERLGPFGLEWEREMEERHYAA